jgi:hypothetical protein
MAITDLTASIVTAQARVPAQVGSGSSERPVKVYPFAGFAARESIVLGLPQNHVPQHRPQLSPNAGSMLLMRRSHSSVV